MTGRSIWAYAWRPWFNVQCKKMKNRGTPDGEWMVRIEMTDSTWKNFKERRIGVALHLHEARCPLRGCCIAYAILSCIRCDIGLFGYYDKTTSLTTRQN